ncbi:hypothetical protein IW262DRAFT_1298286 [Armillaria fumosa]|nr:hypothetical protein IW262DRAFT_1298286 [Armillaria fumosa]
MSRVSPELGQELDYQFSSRRSGMDGVVFEIEILKGWLCSRPSRMEIATEASPSQVPNFRISKFSYSCAFRMTLLRDQGHGLTGLPPCACHHTNLKVRTLPILVRFWVERRAGTDSDILMHVDIWIFSSPFTLSLKHFIPLTSRCLARLQWVSHCGTPPRRLLPHRRFGLVTAITTLTASFVDHHVHFYLDHDDSIKLNVNDTSQRFTRRRTRSIDARSVGLNQSQKTRSRPVLVVFDDGRIHICDVHLKPGDNKGTLTVDCYAFLFDNGRIRIWHAHPQCQPTKCKTLKCTHWDGAGVRDVGNLYSLTEWTSPLLVDIYSGSKQVVMDFDDRRLQINGLHPDARRKWVIEERTQVYRNHRLPNQGRGTDVHTTKGVENPPRFLFDPEAVQGHRVIVAMSLVLNTGKRAVLVRDVRRAAMGRDVEGNIDVGLKLIIPPDIGSLARSDSLPVLDQEVNAAVPPLTDSNSGRRRRESEPLSFVDGEAVIDIYEVIVSKNDKRGTVRKRQLAKCTE